jgi:hypothetical protein
MSSNGSSDSLFGSQGSTRNFTSLLNPSYLQSSTGKESHKRETDGKWFNIVRIIKIRVDHFSFGTGCLHG